MGLEDNRFRVRALSHRSHPESTNPYLPKNKKIANGASRGYGFIRYAAEAAAKQAAQRANGMQVGETEMVATEVVEGAEEEKMMKEWL